MLQRRQKSAAPSFLSTNDVSSSEDEGEGDRFLHEDDDQERVLSTRHGEASEDSTGIKRKQTDAEIASSLNVTKRKKRHILTEAAYDRIERTH